MSDVKDPRLVTIRRGGQMPMTGRRFADIRTGDRFRVENDTTADGWYEAASDPSKGDDGRMGVFAKFDPTDQSPEKW